ncbi:MAG: AAA family ATPase, partial [Candidatus Kapabacteria bacterium]|nr:AAA family ATPase [Candidatus Kapabacteria bacterium]
MEINIPELSLILLVGVSGSGKSSFAKKHFAPTEIVSSDYCRGIVSNDENNQAATDDAFDLLYYITRKRLKNGLLTVIDATNVQQKARKGLIDIAKEYHCLPIAIVLDIPEKVCIERNNQRPDRQFGSHVVRNQKQQLRKSLSDMRYEGFKKVFTLKSVQEVEAVTSIKREKLFNDKKNVHGPFDIIGDIHGCFDELCELLTTLGYIITHIPHTFENHGFSISHPQGRIAVFVGDLVDRGPDSPNVLRIVMSMVNSGSAYCVPGNHDVKLQKFLNNRKVQIKNGLEMTVQQLEQESPEFKSTVATFLHELISHYIFDDGKLLVAHAGLKEQLQGRASAAVRDFCLYGETTGETDEYGLPVRHNWAAEYQGMTKVVYGHTPVVRAEWLNRTIDIDTGCVFGGALTALRYPEEELVSVQAKKVYYEPKRPLNDSPDPSLSAQQEYDDTL